MANDIKKIDDNEEDDTEVTTPVVEQPSTDLFSKLKGLSTPQQESSNAIATLLNQNKDALSQAQDQQKQLQLISMLGHAGATAGAAFAPMANIKPDESFYNNLNRMSEQPVQNVLQQQASQKEALQNASLQQSLKNETDKNDPKSDISRAARDIAKQASESAKLDITIPDNISLANLEKLMPGIENMANRRMQMDAMAQNRQLAREQKTSKEASDLAQKMSNALASDKASSRSALGKAALKLQSSEAIETLASSYKNLNQLDTRQINEIARSLDSLLAGGAATVSGTEHLVPKSALASGSKLMEWISSNPQGAQQGEFVKRMLETVGREKELAQKQLQDYSKKKLPAFNRLKQLDPLTYNQLLTENGLDEDSLKQDRKIAKQAEQEPPHGLTVKQNGHTYTWNAKTGKYE
jgi:hypothetical protein